MASARNTKNDPFLIKRWSEGYFDINSAGNVIVKPDRQGIGGDLFALTSSLVEQGIEPPILIRFNGIIRDRVKLLHNAFRSAIDEFEYRSSHRIAYPIKVNPQRHVLDVVQATGQEYLIGFEVGSKPELLAVLTLESPPETLLICNGYKDAEYISLALMARALGKRPLIIVEQAYELKLILDVAKKLNVEAEIGLRMKLSTKGTGKWESSGGDHAKFGLFTYELVECLKELQAAGKADWLKLLHFHIGSQITTIRSIKNALNEGARMYTEIASEFPSLAFFDVGGGLAVDYDGSKSKRDSSRNYTIEEYARNVVFTIGEACLKAKVPDPIIITESGRATVSHHSVLITEVIDVTSPMTEINTDDFNIPHPILESLKTMLDQLNLENCRETLHDAMELKEQILTEFVHGKLKLQERAVAEKLFRVLLTNIRILYKQLPDVPEEIDSLDKSMAETYFCNFSVFQSLPDSWAIQQLFPIMPIHRLNEPCEHQGTLADLSCDSDGKIDNFIGKQGVTHSLQLHDYHGGAYYIGIFLVGAYQEILGGLHNLFGDTNVVHAELSPTGQWELSKLVEGDTIEEVLHYVQYNPEKLTEQLHTLIEQSIQAGRLSLSDSAQIKKKFKSALESYTYLVV